MLRQKWVAENQIEATMKFDEVSWCFLLKNFQAHKQPEISNCRVTDLKGTEKSICKRL